MPGNSVTILSSQVHPGDSSVQAATSDKVKGDGYFGRSDGLHTVQINLTNFSGEIAIQGSLSIEPTDEDWFTVELSSVDPTTMLIATVDTTGAITASNDNKITLSSISYDGENSNVNYNFTGNFVWLRAVVSGWKTGSISSILMNY